MLLVSAFWSKLCIGAHSNLSSSWIDCLHDLMTSITPLNFTLTHFHMRWRSWILMRLPHTTGSTKAEVSHSLHKWLFRIKGPKLEVWYNSSVNCFHHVSNGWINKQLFGKWYKKRIGPEFQGSVLILLLFSSQDFPNLSIPNKSNKSSPNKSIREGHHVCPSDCVLLLVCGDIVCTAHTLKQRWSKWW